MFLYGIAALVRADMPSLIRDLLDAEYLLPESVYARPFAAFGEFGAFSAVLANHNRSHNLRRLSPIADLIRERATRTDIVFRDVMQAELLLLVRAIVSGDVMWYPHTLVFAGRGKRFPFFVRAIQRS